MRDRYGEGITVVPHRPEWEHQFRAVADALAAGLAALPVDAIEHVGSTSVRGLPAKPVLDIDVVVQRAIMAPAMSALERAGYVHCGDLGMTGREAFTAPDEQPALTAEEKQVIFDLNTRGTSPRREVPGAAG
jgi:GrpB-like predicted nucleotidyltransferase (UPF0157 family)